MENVIEHASRVARDNDIKLIKTISLKVGVMSGVSVDALKFAFESHQAAGEMTDANLKIDVIPAEGKCRECGEVFEVTENWPECRACGSMNIAVTGGNGFFLTDIEGE